MKVSVIIPTKNEPLINELVSQLNEEIAEYDHEVIVVDKSKVPPKLKGAKLLIQKSDGLGNAFMEGVAVSKGDAILLMDGDLSHSPKDVPKLLDALKDSDIVIGSKYMKGGATKDPFYRVIISICSTVFANVILGLGLSDSMSGFCAVRKKASEGVLRDIRKQR